MLLDCADTRGEAVGDGLVLQAARDHGQDLALALAQADHSRCLGENRGDARRDIGSTIQNGGEGSHHLTGVAGFQQHAVRTGVDPLAQYAGGGEASQQQRLLCAFGM